MSFLLLALPSTIKSKDLIDLSGIGVGFDFLHVLFALCHLRVMTPEQPGDARIRDTLEANQVV